MSEISIENKSFFLHRQFVQGHSKMMLRELVKNALESTVNSKEKEIFIGSQSIQGVKKLYIKNTGPGLCPDTLRSCCDLSYSNNKSLDIDGNFGVGAKISSLNSNSQGIIYDSCKDGKVSRAWLRVEKKNDSMYPTYVVHDWDEPNIPHKSDILDVTEKFKDEELNHDWTSVTLLGNEEKQNTCSTPFSNTKVPKNWVGNSLRRKFFKLPEGVKLVISKELHSRPEDQEFIPFHNNIIKYTSLHPKNVQCETISLQNDLKIHYYWDGKPEKDSHNQSWTRIAEDKSFGGVVFKDELYSVKMGQNEWPYTAIKLGINFGSKHTSIIVELPDHWPVAHEQSRERILTNDAQKDEINLLTFADSIQENMPEWLKKRILELTPNQDKDEEIEEYLKNRAKELISRNLATRINNKGNEKVDINVTSEGNYQRSSEKTVRSGVSKTLESMLSVDGKKLGSQKYEPLIPKFIVIDEEKVNEEHRDLKNKAAKYVTSSNTIFINKGYDSFNTLSNFLKNEYANNDPDLLHTVIENEVLRLFKMKLGNAVLFSNIKNKIWDTKDIEDSINPNALSIICDDYDLNLQNLRQRLSVKFAKQIA